MKIKYIGRGIVFCLVAFLLLNFVPYNAEALQPTYSFSTLYKQSKYYDNFSALVLSGDQATDVISVASTQLGYHEGNSDSDFDGSNLSGTRNYVEYNRLYGLIDNNEGNGLSYGYEWCASFVNWTLRQSRVSTASSGSFVSCTAWVSYLMQNSMYKTNSMYTPKKGDLIFFKDSTSSRLSTHIGLVRYTEDNYVYTIEGNSSGAVNMRSYSLDDSYIVGYGIPSYTDNSQLSLDFSGKSNINGTYIVSVNGANLRAQPSLNANTIAYYSRGESVFIDRIEDGWGHTIYKNNDAWISMNVLYLISGNISTISYDMNGGTGEIDSYTKMYNEPYYITDIVPSRDGYNFIGWSDEASSDVAEYIEGNLYNKNNDVALYAVWERIADDDGVNAYNGKSDNNKQNNESTGTTVNTRSDNDNVSSEMVNSNKASSDITVAFMLLSMPLISICLPIIKNKK